LNELEIFGEIAESIAERLLQCHVRFGSPSEHVVIQTLRWAQARFKRDRPKAEVSYSVADEAISHRQWLVPAMRGLPEGEDMSITDDVFYGLQFRLIKTMVFHCCEGVHMIVSPLAKSWD
jgi:hypothetical protein